MATMSLFLPIQISVVSRPSQTSTILASTSTSTSSVRNSRKTVTHLLSKPPPAASLPKKKVHVGGGAGAGASGMGTEEMEAVILVSVLRRAGADVLMASVEKVLEVEGSSGTKLVADAFVTACTNEIFDLVALPGGMPGSSRLRDCEVLKKITSRQAEGERLFGAICSSPAVVLEPWGLMRKKQVTCHPAFMHKLPTFRAVKANIQVSGKLTTSRGPGTSYEFALSFVQQLFGDSRAEEVRGELLIQNEMARVKKEFNSNDWSLIHIPRVLIPIANGCEEMEVVVIVDILRRANIEVIVASVEKNVQIVASQKTKIIADTLIDVAADSIFDLIILPGGLTGSTRLQKSKMLKNLLKDQKTTERIFGAVGSSVAILEKQGLLMNKIVAYHPSITEKVNFQVGDGADTVIDGNLITSRGLVTIVDFSLAIVDKLFGHARARSVAEGIVYEYSRS